MGIVNRGRAAMTEYPNNRFPPGTRVRVVDQGMGNRKYLGTVLWVERLNDAGDPDAWEVELRNGNRGCYDIDHMVAA